MPAPKRAVYCHGGPLNGLGFTEEDWARRLDSERNMSLRDPSRNRYRRALQYREGKRKGLPAGLNASQLKALEPWDVQVWVPKE